MYGNQIEIQRIQSKLRQIGQNNPYRSSGRTQTRGDDFRVDDPPDYKVLPSPQCSSPFPTTQEPKSVVLDKTNHPALELPNSPTALHHSSRLSSTKPTTTELYNSKVGKQARLAIASVSPVMGLAANPETQIRPSSPVSADSSTVIIEGDEYQAGILAAQLRQQYSSSPDYSSLERERKVAVRSLWHNLQQWWLGQSPKVPRHIHPRSIQPPPLPSMPPQHIRRFLLPQAVLWLAGSIVTRLVMDSVLALFPALLLVVMTVVLTPVAIALYQTAINPQGSVHSGRRLLVIMIGLLIGGQF